MSTSNASRFDLAWDMARAVAAVPFGRLFPTLNSPPADLTSKVAIITGGNSGIGLEIALALARQGSTVYLACRSIPKAEAAISQITSQVPAAKERVKPLSLDTSSLDSVRAFATNWEMLGIKIDLLFHNAGIGAPQAGQQFSIDGFPMVYATNLLGSFLLTYLLEPQLSDHARVILTSSVGHYTTAFTSNFSLSSIKKDIEPGFHLTKSSSESRNAASGNTAYYQTKAMQIVFARLLQSYFDNKAAEAGIAGRRTAHAFSPGFVATPFLDKLPNPGFFVNPVFWLLSATIAVIGVSANQGAATGVWLACTDDKSVVGEGSGGGYWDRMSRRVSTVDMMKKDDVERFWVRWEADAGIEWR